MKTPKKKAEELVESMSVWQSLSAIVSYPATSKEYAKQCALIAVDEILKSQKCCDECAEEGSIEISYWQQVKNEIEKL